MHLKLRGPDYKDKDPDSSLEDFRKRIAAYESAYVPLGKFEEDNNLQYIKMIDVGRKFINYNVQGFLANGIAVYLSSFNLSPRQIWVTRHGASEDNELNRIGGNSHLTEDGEDFATALYNLVTRKRKEWEEDQRERAKGAEHLPLMPGDRTPPYPELNRELDEKNFCVWTSMLHRSIETAKEFESDDNFDVKAWAPLKELDAGDFEGLTYDEIRVRYAEEFAKRKADKLNYTYPGVGGEGYLHVIGRLREIIRELERIKDHVLIIGHRSVCRVLMAYFMDLPREDVAGMDIPIGMVVNIEPKPYGMECHAFRYNKETCDFDEVNDYDPHKQALDDGPEWLPRTPDHGNHHLTNGHTAANSHVSVNGKTIANSQDTTNGTFVVNGGALMIDAVALDGQMAVHEQGPVKDEIVIDERPLVTTHLIPTTRPHINGAFQAPSATCSS